jgi:hypothetical protein
MQTSNTFFSGTSNGGMSSGSGHLCIEFHASLHTAKGRALQRSLGKDDFRVPRAFIEDVVFAQAGLEVAEYRPVERRYPKTSDPWFALDGPPATIVIAGWLSEKG